MEQVVANNERQVSPQKQAAKSERMRGAILDEAVGRLAELGYHATSIKKIAAEGGFSIGALQHHFPSKEELMVAVVEKALERAERYVMRFVERGRASLGSMIEASWDEQITCPRTRPCLRYSWQQEPTRPCGGGLHRPSSAIRVRPRHDFPRYWRRMRGATRPHSC
ncbi:MAG: helix-turn-helix domain-containing protein [Nitratireductor sp.]